MNYVEFYLPLSARQLAYAHSIMDEEDHSAPEPGPSAGPEEQGAELSEAQPEPEVKDQNVENESREHAREPQNATSPEGSKSPAKVAKTAKATKTKKTGKGTKVVKRAKASPSPKEHSPAKKVKKGRKAPTNSKAGVRAWRENVKGGEYQALNTAPPELGREKIPNLTKVQDSGIRGAGCSECEKYRGYLQELSSLIGETEQLNPHQQFLQVRQRLVSLNKPLQPSGRSKILA